MSNAALRSNRMRTDKVTSEFCQGGLRGVISLKPRLEVFIYLYITFLDKLTQLIGYNLLEDFRQEGEVGYRSVVG